MIIKSHIRGGFTAMAQYLKEQGQNEKVRVVEISDGVKSLDEAFHRMWEIGSDSKATKPIHHVSINPMKGEWLTDKQVLAIVERLEQKYGYKQFQHQRVIVEHVKDGRQHFHVVWNRVSLQYGTAVWPGLHWKKSKEAAREMEKELGLKTYTPTRKKRTFPRKVISRKTRRTKMVNSATSRRPVAARSIQKRLYATKTKYNALPIPIFKSLAKPKLLRSPPFQLAALKAKPFYPLRRKRRKKYENIPDSEKFHIQRPEMTTAELIAWAFETGNYAVLASFGIYIHPDTFEP